MKHYKNLTELHRENGFPPPEHPLFSIYQCNNTCGFGNREFTSDFYVVGYKKVISGAIMYGRTQYDHECGTLFFLKPRQIMEMRSLELEEDNFLMFIHEDYLNGHLLHTEIRKYHYFDYEINEALHVSPKEENIIWELYRKIEIEYNNNQDEYSREIILSNIDTLLKYAQRFYKRQFISRSEISGKTATRFNEEIDRYVASGLLATKGLPSVQFIADKLNISPGYLSDILKSETGKTSLEHIHIYLISEAKNRLVARDETVSEIAYALGFENLSYFSRLFKKEVGLSHNQFKKQLVL